MSREINLFDARFRPQKPQFSAATLVQALVAVAAAALAIESLYAWQNRTLQATLSQAEGRVAELQARTLNLARDMGGGAALGDELARLEERVRARTSLLARLQGGGGNAEGFSPFLAALARRTLEGVWITGVEIRAEPRQLVLRGRVLESTLVPAYLKRLEREAIFSGRPVHELRLDRGKDAGRHVDFSLTVPLAKGPT